MREVKSTTKSYESALFGLFDSHIAYKTVITDGDDSVEAVGSTPERAQAAASSNWQELQRKRQWREESEAKHQREQKEHEQEEERERRRAQEIEEQEEHRRVRGGHYSDTDAPSYEKSSSTSAAGGGIIGPVVGVLLLLSLLGALSNSISTWFKRAFGPPYFTVTDSILGTGLGFDGIPVGRKTYFWGPSATFVAYFAYKNGAPGVDRIRLDLDDWKGTVSRCEEIIVRTSLGAITCEWRGVPYGTYWVRIRVNGHDMDIYRSYFGSVEVNVGN